MLLPLIVSLGYVVSGLPFPFQDDNSLSLLAQNSDHTFTVSIAGHDVDCIVDSTTSVTWISESLGWAHDGVNLGPFSERGRSGTAYQESFDYSATLPLFNLKSDTLTEQIHVVYTSDIDVPCAIGVGRPLSTIHSLSESSIKAGHAPNPITVYAEKDLLLLGASQPTNFYKAATFGKQQTIKSFDWTTEVSADISQGYTVDGHITTGGSGDHPFKIDTTSSSLTVPRRLIPVLLPEWQKLHLQVHNNGSIFQFPCTHDPILSFTIGGRTIEFAAEASDGSCTPEVYATDDSFITWGVRGISFAFKFDPSNAKVSFGTINRN